MFSQMALATLIVATLFPFAVLTEMISPKERVTLRSRFPGAFYAILSSPMVVLLTAPMRLVWEHSGVRPILDLSGLHPIATVIALLLIHDFLRYVEHRFEHRAWWRVHAIHHAHTDLHAANSYSHPLIAIPEFFIVLIPMSLINFGVGVTFAVWVLIAYQDFFIHSPLRVHWGPLRRIFVDSRFHRIHHSREERHFDMNFGIMFTIWDQLFGTAYWPKPDEWPDVGVADQPPAKKPLDYLFRPLLLPRTQPPSPGVSKGGGSSRAVAGR